MTTIGVVTGLAFEASIARRAFDVDLVRVACAGADSRRAEDAAERLVAAGCRALLSFGIAGGLDPGLGAGSLVVAAAVTTTDGRRWPTEGAWRRRLIAALGDGGPVAAAVVLGSDIALLASSDKRAWHRRAASVAVDMESHAVARVATARGMAFAVLRVIADPADRSLPPSLAVAADEHGVIHPAAVVMRLLRQPTDVAAAARLGLDVARARRSLSRAARLVAPGLHFTA